ncbi:RING-type E3 ubiquitin transferase [Ranunculus cassubicifolius]
MASFVYEDSSEEQSNRVRRSRINNGNNPISPSPPSPQISPLLQQSTRCKPTISSIFLSTFTTNSNLSSTTPAPKSKKKNFSSATFRGLGCTNNNASQVSTPAVVIRSSADWQAKKVRKKKLRKKNQEQVIGTSNLNNNNNNQTTPVVVVPDVWCAPGIGFSADTSVDCVVSRRPVHGRARIDGGERLNSRERSCSTRRATNVEHVSLLDSPSDIETSRFGSDVHGGRHHRHFRHRSPGGLAEIMMFQSSLMMGGRLDGYDRHRDLRLDVDRMSYEELLELGDKIGYVSTGLKEDEIFRCLRKTKHAILGALSSRFSAEIDWKCSICQEEYEPGDEVGKMECSHSYHMSCIKQWLLQKNMCPVCKVSAISQLGE